MKVVFATADTHVAAPWGVQVFLRLGSHWAEDDPIVAAYPSLFSADPAIGLSSSIPPAVAVNRVIVGPEVEQTTADPGSKRDVKRA